MDPACPDPSAEPSTLEQIDAPTQLGVICQLTEGALNPLLQITEGVGRGDRFRRPRDLSAHGLRAAPSLQCHDRSGFWFSLERSSCRCLSQRGGDVAGRSVCRGPEMCLWREDTLANAPLSTPAPCRLAFDPRIFPSPSPQLCSRARSSLLSLTAREKRAGGRGGCCGATWFTPMRGAERDREAEGWSFSSPKGAGDPRWGRAGGVSFPLGGRSIAAAAGV